MDPFTITDLVRKTENEIFADVFDQSSEEGEDNAEFLDADEQSEPEGWDGRALPFEETVSRNLYDDPKTGIDRPLELDQELSYKDLYERANGAIAQLQTHIGQRGIAEDPAAQRLREQQDEDRDLQMMSNPRHFRQTFDQAYQQQADQAAMYRQRYEAQSAMEARAEYGDKHYNEAFGELHALAESDQAAATVVYNNISRSEHPGRALVAWYDNGGARSLGLDTSRHPGVRLPSLNSGATSVGPSRGGGRRESAMDQGWGEESRSFSEEGDLDREIFGFANGR